MIVVAKIGTSSLTDDHGRINEQSIVKLCGEVNQLRTAGHEVVLVTSGAIAAGLPAMGMTGERPKDVITLQAASAVGQSRLLRAYDAALAPWNLVGGQILLSPHDFFDRKQYLHASETLKRMLQLGIIPIVNENDAVADDEIRFGDNDRIAALVARSIGADILVLLTDIPGVFTSDPRFDPDASLIHEIVEVDRELEAIAGGAGTVRGSGGMLSKITAAKMASWGGVRTVIAASSRPNVLVDAVLGSAEVGTVVLPRSKRLSARKTWIAFALRCKGRIIVDAGARVALMKDGRSLLPAGVIGVEGAFDPDSGVEVVDAAGNVFAKGVCRYSSAQLFEHLGLKTKELPDEFRHEAIHRDDLVILE